MKFDNGMGTNHHPTKPHRFLDPRATKKIRLWKRCKTGGRQL